MQDQFPTIAIFKEAATLPLKHMSSVLKSLLFLIAGGLVATVVVFVLFYASGSNYTDPNVLAQNLQNGYGEGVGAILLGSVIFVLFIIGVAAHIFNYWVNLSAYGASEARWSFSDGRFKAMVINGLKLLLIGVLIALVGFVVTSMLSVLGLGPGFGGQAGNTDPLEQYRNGLAGSILITVSYCFIYSLFSANLTYTALQSNAEGMENPYVTDFGVVLIMLYALFVIPSAFAAFIDSALLFWAVQIVLGLFITFAIPAAHGVRYRFCAMQAAPVVSAGDDKPDL